MPCQHVYHKSCIDKSWLKPSNRIRDCWESRDKQWNCAICRENVFKPSEYQYNNSRYTYEVGIFSNVSQYRICYNKCIEITNGLEFIRFDLLDTQNNHSYKIIFNSYFLMKTSKIA